MFLLLDVIASQCHKVWFYLIALEKRRSLGKKLDTLIWKLTRLTAIHLKLASFTNCLHLLHHDHSNSYTGEKENSIVTFSEFCFKWNSGCDETFDLDFPALTVAQKGLLQKAFTAVINFSNLNRIYPYGLQFSGIIMTLIKNYFSRDFSVQQQNNLIVSKDINFHITKINITSRNVMSKVRFIP